MEETASKSMEIKKIKFDGFYLPGTKEYNREAKLILQLLEKHYDVQISDAPDYVFYSVDGADYYKYDCIRIFCTIEALAPDFNLADYGIGFEYIDYADRYFRFPNYIFYAGLAEKMADKHKNITKDMASRDFCSFVYSNAAAAPKRGELFHTLSRYRTVDAGGAYLNNMPGGNRVKDKFAFECAHKFSISCENAAHPGYHTEKLAEAFAAKTIPIYWGDPEVKKIFNSKAFINADDYETEEDLLKAIEELDQNEDKYLEMLREPALISNPADGNAFEEELIKQLEDYLVHIMDQPVGKAYRRNLGFWGEQYLDRKRCESRIIEKYMNFRNGHAGRLLRKLKGK